MEMDASAMASAQGTAAERATQGAGNSRVAETGARAGAKAVPGGAKGASALGAAGNNPARRAQAAAKDVAFPQGGPQGKAAQTAKTEGGGKVQPGGSARGENALPGNAPVSSADLESIVNYLKEARQRRMPQAAASQTGEQPARTGREDVSAQTATGRSPTQAMLPPYQQAAIGHQQAIASIHAGWNQQAQMTQSAYPGFQLQQEMRNPRFSKLLSMGVDVRTAYEAAHREEMLMDAMAFTADRVREMAVRDIQARGLRPAENGESGRGYAPYPSAVRDSTRSQREAWEQEARQRKVVLR